MVTTTSLRGELSSWCWTRSSARCYPDEHERWRLSCSVWNQRYVNYFRRSRELLRARGKALPTLCLHAVSRVLITGGSGFVGRCLSNELTRQGYLVRIAAREHARAAGVTGEIVVTGPVESVVDWSDALREVQVVIHLAARVH